VTSISTRHIWFCTRYAYVLRPPQRDPGNPSDLLQPETDQRLPRLALRTALDLVQRGVTVLMIMIVVMVMVVVVVVIMVVVMIMIVGVNLRLVVGELFDIGHFRF
jgi:hypothetical protein